MCIECLAQRKLFASSSPVAASRRNKMFYDKNTEAMRQRRRDYLQKIRKEILSAYGGCCVCCGETEPMFMTIDHIAGYKAAPSGAPRAGQALYQWLRYNGFPKDGFQLLCYNCNCAKGYYGQCPHERLKNNKVVLLQSMQNQSI